MKYGYKCKNCGKEVDLDFEMGKAPEWVSDRCPQCDVLGPHQRVFRIAGIQFKGTGFASTEGRPYIDRALLR